MEDVTHEEQQDYEEAVSNTQVPVDEEELEEADAVDIGSEDSEDDSGLVSSEGSDATPVSGDESSSSDGADTGDFVNQDSQEQIQMDSSADSE
jgi:hypothetical protein